MNKENQIYKKSKNAKAAGLKSTFVIDDRLLMTSFGKGNKAYLEKEILGADIKELKDPKGFEISGEQRGFAIKGNGISSFADNPMLSVKGVGEDMIERKDVLEEKFFGKTFSDNIHIQLAYNISDIEKILAVHVNNIVYAIDNIQRREDTETLDFMGAMNADYSYDDFKAKKTGLHKALEEYAKNPRLAYFGDAFYSEQGKGKKDKKLNTKLKLDKKKLYYMLSLLGELRQFTAHGSDRIYNIETALHPEFKEALDKEYSLKIDSLNRGFANNNKANYAILFFVMGANGYKDKCSIVKNFYEFTVKKNYKNMGFSIKRLRELMVLLNIPEFKTNKKYDSMRQKLNAMLDFIIFDYYLTHEKQAEANVCALRTTLSEEGKEKIYTDEANRLYTILEKKILKIKNKMNGNEIRNAAKELLKADKELIEKAVGDVALKNDANYFCKLIYYITKVLDGKEINDLLTTLINKFDNIASFIDVMKEYNIDCEFKQNYKMFEQSAKITDDLKVINSFARMSSPLPSAKEILFAEAAEILGTDLDEEELSKYLQDNVMGSEIKRGHGFRNFIANNVIESSRFKYLVRYANPKKVRAVAENRNVVEFVLRQIDKEHKEKKQINRYYASCVSESPASYETKISALTDVITGISFKQFENVDQAARRGSREEADKVKKQAIISLYLTVLYLLVKNLVNVNSRYFLAFNCLVRDAKLYGISEDELRKENMNKLTEIILEKKKADINEWFNSLQEPNRNRRKRKWRIERNCGLVESDMSHIDQTTLRAFRNNADHLSAVRNINLYIKDAASFKSYFELYHYLMQRTIISGQKEFPTKHEKVMEYSKAVLEYNRYCKDFVKALCTPFGYNYPRFKNLSIEGLFDMHNTTGEEKCEK